MSDALLLRAVDFRDADRILTWFTRDLGKLSAVARGARGSKRRFPGALEPYAIVRVELAPSRGDVWTLSAASIQHSFSGILSDLARMDAASAALTLLRDLQDSRVSDPSLFLSAVQYLTLVDLEGDLKRSGLLAFCMRVLGLLGMAPRFEVCGRSGEAVPPGRPAYFDPQVGAVVAKRFGGGPFLLSASALRRLGQAQTYAWLGVAREEWEPADLSQARAALAAFLRLHAPAHVATRLFPEETART